jgi:hypothetical protein
MVYFSLHCESAADWTTVEFFFDSRKQVEILSSPKCPDRLLGATSLKFSAYQESSPGKGINMERLSDHQILITEWSYASTLTSLLWACIAKNVPSLLRMA